MLINATVGTIIGKRDELFEGMFSDTPPQDAMRAAQGSRHGISSRRHRPGEEKAG